MTLRAAPTLASLYGDAAGPVFMTGIQALVRLPMMQRRLDRQRGLNTAGLISGYRGSPLGAYDQQLWKASKVLAEHDIVFQPGLNEDLAATALWGAQMHRAYGPTRVDGVFGVWYGKGPGVDRTGDVFRTANMLGTSPLGGVLAVAGDDHAAQSSMYPHQTDGIFQSVLMPVLQPASVQEILSLGLAGFALSRFSGLWVAMKTIAEVVESASTFDIDQTLTSFTPPNNIDTSRLNWDPGIAWPAQRGELERRMIEERLPASVAWARANQLDRAVVVSEARRICFVTVGKAHQDLMQAFSDLGLSGRDLADLGVSVWKVAMSWPLDTASLLAFADRFDDIVVVEEKQPIVEGQLKAALYHQPADRRPRVSGKTTSDGAPLFPTVSEFSPLIVARGVVGRLDNTPAFERLSQRLHALEQRMDVGRGGAFPVRKPFFCSGCPHNSSTRTPDGSIAGGGIGCHVMALSQPALKTSTFSQMGGEGAQWVGAAPFSQTGHIFQNLGDGTYQHSGLLAIRAAVAAKAPITYKILYNDAVAMTGGQPAEGALTPGAISRQLWAEGVADIRLVSDDPDRWQDEPSLATGVKVHHRDDLDAVQRELRETAGVTTIIYEQTCAAEKRRRRKRGAAPDPDRRLFINSRVCEGCGDCSVQSNCIAVEPLETDFGRKRRINQSSCNKDFSCVKGFCPSFVEIDGPVLNRPDRDRLATFEAQRFPTLPAPAIANIEGVFNVYVAGIGGLGVLTLGALLGTAAHVDGLSATVLDFTGLAQKNGAVVSQVRIAPADAPIHAVRVGPGEVDLMLAADAVAASAADGMLKLAPTRTAVVINTDETPTADVVTDRDASLPTALMIGALKKRAAQSHEVAMASLAMGLFGDGVAANVMLLGFAWQKGLVPLSLAALRAGIASIGAAVEMNNRALDWGRLAAVDMEAARRMAGLSVPEPVKTIAQLIAQRADDLGAYQSPAYGQRYLDLIDRVQVAVSRSGQSSGALLRAVAQNAYRLMAYKDEYEVARLYASASFREELGAQFSKTGKVSLWLAPPLLSRTDPRTGRPAKRKFGPWIFTALGVLARLRGLRGGWADPFGYTHERRMERRLRDDYLAMMDEVCAELDAGNVELATEIAALPSMVRGFGVVKAQAVSAYEARKAELLHRWRSPAAAPPSLQPLAAE